MIDDSVSDLLFCDFAIAVKNIDDFDLKNK